MKTFEIKWSQWNPDAGMLRCGRADYDTIMNWMKQLGNDAKACVMNQEKEHAMYGMKIYDDDAKLSEVRFYSEAYLTTDELISLVEKMPRNAFYVAHKYI